MMNGPWDAETFGSPTLRGGALRLLVTGVDGPIGGNVAYGLLRRASVIGLYHDTPVALPNGQVERWDGTGTSTLTRHVREEKPHWIIHCGPLARPRWDFADAPGEQRLPPAAQERAICRCLVREAQRLEARLTVLTTDAVFAGPHLFHSESSSPAVRHPVVRVANAVLKAVDGSGALVVRTCAYGWSPCEEQPSFAERAWLAAAEGLSYPIDPEAHATPILATDLASLLWQAYRQGLCGVRHIAGAERTSARRFAHELASLAGQPRPALSLRGEDDKRSATARLSETSLDSSQARRELNRPMPMLREGLARFLDQIRDGTRAHLRGRQSAAVTSEAA